MNQPERAMKISAEGYRQIVRKHRKTLKIMNEQITDEGKLVFASKSFLLRLRMDLQDYVQLDETLVTRISASQNNRSRPGEWDDEKILSEPDPYIAILHVIDAIIEFYVDPEKQPGIKQYKGRFSNFAQP